MGLSTGLFDKTKWEDLSRSEKEAWINVGKTQNEWKGREIFEGDVIDTGTMRVLRSGD